MKLLALLPLLAIANAATLTVTGPATVRPGVTIQLPINLANSGGAVGVQFTLTGPTDLVSISISTPVTSKQITCTPPASGKTTCIEFGVNATVLVDGVVATATVVIAESPASTAETFALTGLVAPSATGSALTLTAGPNLSIPVKNPCDVSGDGPVTLVDVLAEVQWALGLAAPPAGVVADLNGDSKTDVLDVQIIANAVTGSCTAN